MELTKDTRDRLDIAMTSAGAGGEIERLLTAGALGDIYYVDTVNGADVNNGLTWDQAFATVEQAFTKIASHDTIYITGAVREQITAPLGVYGVQLIGAARGRPRHTTASGVVLTGNGADWREAATAGDAPLLTLREQGWEVRNILFVPQSGYGSIRLRREESATYPDASHAKIVGNRFISGGTRVGYGVEDYGGAFNVLIEDNDFVNLEFGIIQSNVSIANFNGNIVQGNRFWGCKNDISVNGANNLIRANLFKTAYDGSTHPLTVDLVKTVDSAVPNWVIENYFADATADATTAKGYKEATGDIWRNYVTDAADAVVAVPS